MIVDARGNPVELRQYQGSAPSGAYDATTYTYDPQGRPKTITDAVGNTWTYGYDLTEERATSLTGPLLASWSYNSAR